MKPLCLIALVGSSLLLAGCASAPQVITTPGPTVTVTATPSAEPPAASAAPDPVVAPSPQVGDALTPLNAWDVCFAHTTAMVNSDMTEWSRFSADAVKQNGPGSFTVTIADVRNNSDAPKKVSCVVEGRLGGVVLAHWSRN